MTQTTKTILLVDDEERLLDSISKRISLLGFSPLKATSGQQAIEIVKQTQVDLAIVDLKMPDMDGLVTIAKLKEITPELNTILLTGYGNEKIKQATESLDSLYVEKDAMGGLWDIIKQSSTQGKVVVIRPPAGPTTADKFVSEQVEILDPLSQNKPIAHRLPKPGPGKRPNPLSKIIGGTPEIQRLKKNIRRFAEMDCAIIIRGEIGTGKELVARTIHNLSHRKQQRFLAFDCGCFSKDFRFAQLVASYDDTPKNDPLKKEYGALNPPYTGTILLDHIENMPKKPQQEMLQLIDGKTSDSAPFMDVRFIVVAHQSIEEKIIEGKFQMELYRRIRAIEIEIPPLRRRLEDLSILCHYFLGQLNEEFGKKIKTFSDDVFSLFEAYEFPGNIRELRHIIERAVILAQGDIITGKHLPKKLSQKNITHTPDDTSPFLTVQQMEQKHILKAIEITHGNKTRAAELLGISRAALWRKLRLISEKS
ncbi:MAG: sigma-54-dependent Fis family transcriptional regulator [Desulfobacter sp.]|nr:MAG: sigma-54-dependent Fis family transcriptional regulator [Desulfobacter sp.]